MAASRFPILRGPDAQQSRVQDNVQGVLAPVARALQNTPIMGAASPAWIRPTLLNGFGAPAVVAPPFDDVAFTKNALGEVWVKGACSHAAGTAAFTTIFLLPLGYRPSRLRQIPVSGSAGAAQSVWVLPSGEVQNRILMAAGVSLYPEFSFLAEG